MLKESVVEWLTVLLQSYKSETYSVKWDYKYDTLDHFVSTQLKIVDMMTVSINSCIFVKIKKSVAIKIKAYSAKNHQYLQVETIQSKMLDIMEQIVWYRHAVWIREDTEKMIKMIKIET